MASLADLTAFLSREDSARDAAGTERGLAVGGGRDNLSDASDPVNGTMPGRYV